MTNQKPPREGQRIAHGRLGRLAFFLTIHWRIGRTFRNVAVNERQLRDYDRKRRHARPLAGLSFLLKTNMPGHILLVSRHWPHRICWDWHVSWHAHRPDAGGPYPIGLMIGNRWQQKFELALGFGSLAFVKQNYSYMLRDYGPDPAPKPIYEHQITHEAGHA